MSLGDHLEELRSRLLKGIYFFIVAAGLCLWFGDRVMALFCKPLTDGLQKYNLPPQLITTGLTDSFSVYMNVSLIVAGAFAAPFALYQLWQFIAAGLYPKERKYVTKYMPFSLILLISGMLFLYLVVLPITVKFLIHFTVGIQPIRLQTPTTQPTTQQVMIAPTLYGDPAEPLAGQLWYNSYDHKLKFFVNHEIRVLQFGSDNLLSPLIDLRAYINLVLILLVLFGVSFQLPLVVMAIARMGLVEIATLKKGRRVVYFLISILCAVIVPDVVTGMIALMIPMVFLYELGIYLAIRSERHARLAEKAEEASEREQARIEREKRAAARAHQASAQAAPHAPQPATTPEPPHADAAPPADTSAATTESAQIVPPAPPVAEAHPEPTAPIQPDVGPETSAPQPPTDNNKPQ
ncbi:MAG: twin-arginine translocase subunit TatC [Tepidisphaeraceae bacterium]